MRSLRAGPPVLPSAFLAALLALAACAANGPAPATGAGAIGGAGTGAGGTQAAGGADAAADDASTSDGAAAAPAISRTALLRAFGDCALSTARDFLPEATALETATAALAAAAAPDASLREAAREAFRRATRAWQVVEPMQFGPAAPQQNADGVVPGGQDLRDHIYSWSTVNHCIVEDQLASRSYAAPTFPSSLINKRGLYAIEYLLFVDGTDKLCPANAELAALPAGELDVRKRAYAAAAAADVRLRAAALVEAWEPDKGGFLTKLETAGPGNSIYSTTQLALNAVSNAMFYIEIADKDMKVMPVLGLGACFADMRCAEPESPYAHVSTANVRANVTGFRRLVEGCGTDYAGLGFDDLLESVGAGALATGLRQQGAAAQAAVEAIEEADLGAAAVADKPSVMALYDALKSVTDLLKVDFVTILALKVPSASGSDND